MKTAICKLPAALLAAALLFGCAGPAAQMKASVEEAAAAKVLSVSGEEQADRVRLTIQGSTGLAYTVFRLSEPLRLIVDLADADVTSLGEEIPINLGNVSAVHPIQFDEAAGKIGRLEVSLLELWEYETSRVDNSIVIEFINPASAKEAAPASEAPAVPAEKPIEVVELSMPAPAATPAPPPAPAPEPLPPARVISDVLFAQEGGMVRVDLVADGAVEKFKTMALKGPARVVVDVQGVGKGFKATTIPVGTGAVSRVRVGDHAREGYLRFVIDIAGDAVPEYSAVPEGRKLALRVGPGAAAASAPAPPAAAVAPQAVSAPAPAPEPAAAVSPPSEPQPAPAVTGPSVSDIRYRTEKDGGALVVVADAPLGYNITAPDPSHIVLDLEKVTLPKGLVRSQDTRDVGGPVASVSSFNPKVGSGARINLTVASGTTYEVDQTGNTLTVVLSAPTAPAAPAPAQAQPPAEAPEPAVAAVEKAVSLEPSPVAPAPTPKTKAERAARTVEEKRFTGEKMTLDFQNADVLNVLRLIAEVSGLNIITSEAVGGKVTMRMVNVPWDQALEVILRTKGLDQVRDGNVIRIAPRAQIESEKAAELKSRENEEKVQDLALEIIPISYAKAEELVSQLGGFLSSRGSITTDRRTNSLIVKDLAENIARVKSLVADLDIPTPQVRIEARIVIVDESYVRNLGIKWGGAYNDGTNQVFGNVSGADAVYGGGNFLVNLPASNPSAILGFSFGGIDNFDSLDLRLSALEQANKGRIISSPTLMVIQNEEASIEVNNPFPENRSSTTVGEGGATTTTEVSFPDIWTKLKIKPQVTSNKDIFMDVNVEKDSKGQQAVFEENTFTGVNTHKLETKIMLNNHGTVVIGGVYTEAEKDGGGGVPFLSKIPILGWLFKNKNTEKTREELLIFLNATVVEG